MDFADFLINRLLKHQLI